MMQRKGKPQYKSNDQKSAINNINMIYKSRETVIKFFDDYSSIVPKAKHEASKRTGLKILTPKRLSTAVAQLKAGNNSESY